MEPMVLRDGLIFGRSPEADLVLADPSVSRRHLAVRAVGDGWLVEDLGSRSGSFLNGRLFEKKELVYGDVLRVGPFGFRFDGERLAEVPDGGGAELACRDLRKTASGNVILDDISIKIGAGQFVGVIGPSGAGKSTLLDALCALRPADSGVVTVDGRNLYENADLLKDSFGYVPQDDIVPVELTVERALFFSAWLRLPKGTPVAERRRLVASVIEDLGLAARAGTKVGALSGGQRKRVSVAAELLGRPRLLFLDEPTSGLDPAAEFSLMQLLRRLAANGCTVVCTTHVMENAFLMDALAVLYSGRLVFLGDAAAARERFDVPRLTMLYERLLERSPEEWGGEVSAGGVSASPSFGGGSAGSRAGRAGSSRSPGSLRSSGSPRSSALGILLVREWAILGSDWKNLAILLGQPIFIGVLVTWVSPNAALVLFFAYIATLWFGCGNAAQEIVKELPMFRRERLVGLGRNAYLMAKFLSLTRITVVQSLLLYGTMALCTGGIGGAAGWQVAGLVMTCLAAVGIGLAISAVARSVLQAVMLVPLVLIPQILFSGFTPPGGKMEAGPYWVSRVMPSAAAQSVMDVSLFLDQKVVPGMAYDYPAAYTNLDKGHELKTGEVFDETRLGWLSLAGLMAWAVGTYGIAWLALRRRERG